MISFLIMLLTFCLKKIKIFHNWNLWSKSLRKESESIMEDFYHFWKKLYNYFSKMVYLRFYSQQKLFQWVLTCLQEQSFLHQWKNGMVRNQDGLPVANIFKWVVEQVEEGLIKKVWQFWCLMKKWNHKLPRTC